MPFSEEQTRGLKQKLLKKGQELAQMLADLLAGNTPPGMAELKGKPGETPEEMLRRYLGVIQDRLTRLREGTYGKCEQCGKEIRFVELDEMPWADTCGECAAKGLAV